MDINKSNTYPVPNGILLVIGGHENKDGKAEKRVQEGDCNPREILETFIQLTGKKDPVIEVITTASSEGDESFEDYQKAFAELGIDQVGHIHHDKRDQVLHQSFEDRRDKADAVFFSGGDQLKLTPRMAAPHSCCA